MYCLFYFVLLVFVIIKIILVEFIVFILFTTTQILHKSKQNLNEI